jgi:hypothetical protein
MNSLFNATLRIKKKRRLKTKVPITYITLEPYLEHLGLGGIGHSKPKD